MKPKLYILAGANGSGKSTISKVLLPAEGIVYINPDDIARELNPENPVAARIQAGKETLGRIDALLARGESFAIESTLSGLGYLSVIKRARESGYEILICYTFVDSPEACIERILTLNAAYDMRDVVVTSVGDCRCEVGKLERCHA